MHRSALLLAVLAATACAGTSAPETPAHPALAPIRLSETGDSVMYLERSNSMTLISRPTDTLEVEAFHDAVIHVVRTAPDTLEAFYEHLLLRFETPTETRRIDTSTLLGPRFVLHEDDGRIELLRSPEQPPELRQLTDLRRQFDDFFLRVPRTPMSVGSEWVDTVRFAGSEGESSTDRHVVTRFTVRGDTVVHDLAALVIDYESVIENRLRTAPTTQGTFESFMTGGEEGTFIYAPAREVMLRRERLGVLEGEIVVEGSLQTQRFPQAFSYHSTIELIPPYVPGAEPARPGEPVAEP